MRQYASIKAQYPDAILLFRVGDFYETFDADAQLAARVLGITLTKRSNGAAADQDLAGFPYHALNTYLPKLVRAGYRVAICEQLEDPKAAKTIVRRGVTELITPGITLHEHVLNQKTNNFLCALHFGTQKIGMAWVDISTGEFYCTSGDNRSIDQLLSSWQPAEIIFSRTCKKTFLQQFGSKYYTYALDDWVFQYEFAYEQLTSHFETRTLKGFGIEEMPESIIACGAIIHYLKRSEQTQLPHIKAISRFDPTDTVWLDRFTTRNLELLNSLNPGGRSLLQVLDHTETPMGARLLRKWVITPLNQVAPLNERLDQIESLLKNRSVAEQLKTILQELGDLERLTARLAIGRITPRELLHIQRALQAVQRIKQVLATADAPLRLLGVQLDPCQWMHDTIARQVRPDAPTQLQKGQVIQSGVCPELDELRKTVLQAKKALVEIQKREAQQTGIPSLRINYNQVFGYFIEVTQTHKDKVPPTWIRKQTLAQAERYVTTEIKEWEEKILWAEEKIAAREQALYEQLTESLRQHVLPLQHNARLLAHLDVVCGLAELALKHRYCRPKLLAEGPIDIRQGRHPIIEQQMSMAQPYVPNDCFLDEENQQIMIITGPNMSGKSAYIRQNALIVLMAQIGSFVPAESATIGLVDKIFTRLGASDNLAAGESTFMVEMVETASILHNATGRSLIILDEIGRGTSTYDGISIAWAVAEYLHNHPRGRPKTLFATHYHELAGLEEKYDRIVNYNIAVQEVGSDIVFLHELRKGSAAHSFGIHVAQMAGLPSSVIERAMAILHILEQKQVASSLPQKLKNLTPKPTQLTLFAEDPDIRQFREWLVATDPNTLTPVEALLKIAEWRRRLQENS